MKYFPSISLETPCYLFNSSGERRVIEDKNQLIENLVHGSRFSESQIEQNPNSFFGLDVSKLRGASFHTEVAAAMERLLNLYGQEYAKVKNLIQAPTGYVKYLPPKAETVDDAVLHAFRTLVRLLSNEVPLNIKTIRIDSNLETGDVALAESAESASAAEKEVVTLPPVLPSFALPPQKDGSPAPAAPAEDVDASEDVSIGQVLPSDPPAGGKPAKSVRKPARKPARKKKTARKNAKKG